MNPLRWPPLLLAAISIAFLADVSLTGRAYVLRDIVTFFHPWQHAIRESIRSGHLPLWNHNTLCGVPLLANLQSGFFYPPNWLYWFLSFDRALTLGMILHLTLAGALMHAFLRRVGAGPAGAFFGAASFAWGAWSMAHLEFPMKLGSAVWLPLMWIGIRQATSEGRARGIAVTAVAIALSVFAGYPQITFFGLISGAILWLASLPAAVRTEGSRANRVIRTAGVPGAIGLGALLAAVQLVPAAEMTALSSKAAPYDAAVALTRSLPPRNLLGLVDPFFFGFPGIDRFWGGEIVEFAFGAFYPGVLAVLAAVFAGPASVRAWRRGDAVPAFLWAGLLAGVVLALGRHSFVYPWLHEHVAGFGRSRWPSAAGYLIAVHAAALGGVGLGEIVGDRGRARRASYGALAVGLLLVAAWSLARGPATDAFRALQLAGTPPYQGAPYEAFRDAWLATLPVRGVQIAAAGVLGLVLAGAPRRFSVVWIAILVLDLLFAAGRFEMPTSRGFYDYVPESVAEIRKELGYRRVFTPRATDQLGNFLYGTRELTPFEWGRRAMLCNANGPAGIRQANGCEPLGPRRHDAFTQAFDSDQTPWEIKERLFDLWDAGLLLTSSVRPLEVPALRNPGEGIELSRHEPRLGRASLLTGWKTPSDARSLLAELLSPGHDPAQVTLLEAAPGHALPPPAATATEPSLPVLWEPVPNGLRVAWASGPAGVLRVLESWAPGWEATVNGEPTAVHRADFLFMAVPVPRGPCEVELTYRPTSLRRGLWLSLLGLVGIGGCLLVDRRTNSIPSKLH